jgi:small subunit ribosomal protein S6
MKTYYECTFIVNSGLDDAQIENTIKATEETITKNGGTIVNTDRIGRRRLAYPITKKHNGFYTCIEFEAEARSIEKVERYLTLDENVMRYLTLKLDKRMLDAKRNRAAANALAAELAAAAEEGRDVRPAVTAPAAE